MGKSKRNRKKNKKFINQTAFQAEASQDPFLEISGETSPLSKTSWLLIFLVFLVTVLAAFKLVHSANGEITTSVSPAASGASQSQTGGSQPLSPSGSVDLQPTGNAAQAGGVQAGQSL